MRIYVRAESTRSVVSATRSGRALTWARRLTAALAVAGGVSYLVWRLSTLSGTGVAGLVFYAAEAVTFGLFAISAFVVVRVRGQRPAPGPPHGTLDVFVTVCGEPVELVERTLRAALAVAYPHATYVLNDGYIAGNADWRDAEELADRLGIPCFTRRDGTRGKAGNLNHAFFRTNGDFVVTIDADHTAEQDLAEQTLGYFDDERLGFVCSSQRFSAGRGRDALNNQESFFYEFLQPAKDLDSAAFSCGNATVYRRTALYSIGGFSEWNLVEDLHTSYLLHAAGWRSVYHTRPITSGTAPKTPSVYLKQRMRWAMDSTRLLFWDCPLWKRGLTPMQRVHYLHTTSFYPLTSLQVLLMLGAPLYIFGRISLVNGATGPYLRHAVPYFLSLLAYLSLHGGVRGAFRILQSTVFAACAYLLATVLALLGIPPDSSPTKKGRQRWFSPLLLPPILLFVLLVASVVYTAVDDSPGRSAVAVFWSTFLAFLLAGPLTALADRPRLERLASGVVRLGIVAGGALLLAFDLIPEAVSDAAGASCAPSAALAQSALGPRLEPPDRGAYFGAAAPGLADCGGAIDRWNRELGNELAIVHWYQRWRSPQPDFPAGAAGDVAEHAAVPMISWEPWSEASAAIRVEDIARGRLDAYVRAWARDAAAYGGPVLLRPMHAMNGNWFPWSVTARGSSPQLFVQAWRHIHDLFQREGASNVTWVWSVSSFAGLAGDNRDLLSYYPGDWYVDWVALSAFNWGAATDFGTWRSPDALLGPTYAELTRRFTKPVMLAEIGTVAQGGDPAAWIAQAMRASERDFPDVGAVVWFGEQSGTADFRLRGALSAAMRNVFTRSRHWAARVPAG